MTCDVKFFTYLFTFSCSRIPQSSCFITACSKNSCSLWVKTRLNMRQTNILHLQHSNVKKTINLYIKQLFPTLYLRYFSFVSLQFCYTVLGNRVVHPGCSLKTNRNIITFFTCTVDVYIVNSYTYRCIYTVNS